ncbi:MAG: hypothetical protein KAI79_01440, partial [Bacteroidales bacterium]|nr:hypothetical protein [Bacteroidales bacterium]
DTGKQVRRCPNCGAPIPQPISGLPVERNPYYLPPKSEQIILQDEYAKKLAEAGPNWTCTSCDSSVSPLRNHCDSCGTGRNGEKPPVKPEVVINIPKETDRSQQFKKEEKSANKKEQSENHKQKQEKKQRKRKTQPKKPFFKRYKIAIIILTILTVIVAGRALYLKQFYKTTAELAQVNSLLWQRTIHMQEFKALRESKWANDKIPEDAYDKTESERIRSYESVPDGKEKIEITKYKKVTKYKTSTSTRIINNANGTATEETYTYSEPYTEEEPFTEYKYKTKYKEVPVYDTEINYTVNRWVVMNGVFTSGKDRNLFWPNFQFSEHSPVQFGDTREKFRTTEYFLFITEKGNKKSPELPPRTFTVRIDTSQWASTNIDDLLYLEYHKFGELKQVYTTKSWEFKQKNGKENNSNLWISHLFTDILKTVGWIIGLGILVVIIMIKSKK